MANYHYDEAGNMAAYFILTILSLTLIPWTISSLTSSKKIKENGCTCQPCLEQRERNRRRRTTLIPSLGIKTVVATLGWVVFAYTAYRVATTKNDSKAYDPFEILGLRVGTVEKEIKSHYKQLSRKFHPDKVKLAANQTLESVEAYFVDLTKAYKALTDETIRKNWELYGHPDGRQEVSMGIAIPQWVIEGKNNIWVLGLYGLVFGGGLPYLVGRWWFGHTQKTKDGVNIRTAASFFKGLREDSSIDDILGALGKAYEWEPSVSKKFSEAQQLSALEKEVQEQLGEATWSEMQKLAAVSEGKHGARGRALILLYAHLLRLSVRDPVLLKEQTDLLLQTPVLLNSLLSISMSRNWLLPTLAAMRLHAHLAQAVPPGPERKADDKISDIETAEERWERLDVVDASFKVIGERAVVPSSIVYLVVKLRLSPPTSSSPVSGSKDEEDVEEIKRQTKLNEDQDELFLTTRKDAEDLPSNASSGWAHAPYWPANRRAGWWIVLGDEKSNRVVVPPMRISEVPFSDPSRPRNYRSYKLQFQAPAGVGMYTWKVYFVSDTFIGEEVTRQVVLKIEDVSALNADEQVVEDDISDPEEDSLAGQMAVMRGGTVKRSQAVESDDESGTDDDKDSESSDSSSDSD